MTSDDGTGRDGASPGRSLDVEPTRLRGSGGGPRRAVAALALIGAVIAGAIGLAEAGAARDRPSVAVNASPSAPAGVGYAASSSSPGPVASVLQATSPRMRPSDLAAAVGDGSLDGRLVFVDGQLSLRSVDCDNLAAVRRGCVDLSIPRLGIPVRAASPSLAWTSIPRVAWLVTVARAGSLVYLGSLVPDPQVATGIGDLEDRLKGLSPGTDTGTLFETNGTLLTGAPSPCSGVCPSEPPTLSAPLLLDEALPTGTVVSVPKDAPEVDTTVQWMDGPFLVARSSDPGDWRIVARYVPSKAVRVLVP